MDPSIRGLVDVAFDQWTLLVAGGVFIFIRMLSQIPLIKKSSIFKRILPVLPEILGSVAAIFGGIPAVQKQHFIVKIAAGLWCGYLAQRFHKILGQTFLGDDNIIEAKKGSTNGMGQD